MTKATSGDNRVELQRFGFSSIGFLPDKRLSFATESSTRNKIAVTRENAWSKDDAADLYGLNRWSAGFFSIDDHGRFLV
ncbi:MAG: hypothetical protein AAF539_02195, partial [Planctomycetota bacterium]